MNMIRVQLLHMIDINIEKEKRDSRGLIYVFVFQKIRRRHQYSIISNKTVIK